MRFDVFRAIAGPSRPSADVPSLRTGPTSVGPWWATLPAARWTRVGRLGLFAALVTALVQAAPKTAQAVGTRTFDLDTESKLSGGEQEGTAVTSSGEIEAGWLSKRSTVTQGTTVFSALALDDGSVLLGVGNEGRVLKVDRQGQEYVVAETGALAVTSLSMGPGGKVYAGTLPEGEIFVVDPAAAVPVGRSAPKPPKPAAWTKLASEHVWALSYDRRRNELFAATGPDGRVYRIDAQGRSQVHYEGTDSQVVSLGISPQGTLYAGTSPKGLLLAISGPGKAEVVNDFDGHEVKAIDFGPPAPGPSAKQLGPDTLYCLVNEYPSPPDPPRRSGVSTRPVSAAAEAPRPSKGKGQLWKVSGLTAAGTQGKSERLFEDRGTHLFSLAVVQRPTVNGPAAYVGTALDGRVIAVSDTHETSVVAKVESRSVGAIGLGATPGATWFAAGDPAALHRVSSIGGEGATWTSRVLDAGLRARFGRLMFRTANGVVELQARSGSTSTPDAWWSPWSTAISQPGKLTIPDGRFVQLRARWRGAAAVLRGVSLAFVTDNLRATVTDINVPTKGPLPSGVPASGSEAPAHANTIRLTWKVDNPDNDALRYRLWYRRDDSTIWRRLTEEDDLPTSPEYTWSTETLSEGYYRVRVEASDEVANPIGTSSRHALESLPFLVDNTPPVIRTLALRGNRLQAEVVDGLGPIARLEVQIDGRPPWLPVTSVDQVLDEATERVDVALPLTAGPHVVALRAYDAAGNAVTREVEGKI